MSSSKKKEESISLSEISIWGIYKQLRFEQNIDNYLKNIDLPSKDKFEKIVEQWCRAKNILDSEKLKEWKLYKGLEGNQWNLYVTRKWRWTKWCLEEFKDKIPSYYLEKKSMLDKVDYSLIRVLNQNLANEIFLRIKEGEVKFEEIANNYSEGPEKETFGHIGPISIGQAQPELAKLLQVSQEGQIWPPKKIEKWWVIVRLNSIENVPLDKKLTEFLALELGLKHLELEFKKNLKKEKE